MAPPTVLTLAELIELVQLALRSVPILTAALVFHEIFYSSYVTRAATFGLIFCVSTPPWQSHNIKSTFPAYGVGLLTAYLLIVSAVMLLCYNPAKDCRKLDDGKSKESIRSGGQSKSLITRLIWALELLNTPRGIGWNFEPKNRLRAAAKEALRLKEDEDSEASSIKGSLELKEAAAKKARSSFIRQNLLITSIDYIALAFGVYLVHQDPFLSGDDVPNPFYLQSGPLRTWLLLLPYRLLVTGLGVYTIIDVIAKLTATFFVGVLGEKWVGSLWGNYRNWPPVFGSIWSIWDRGLAGFWGDFWHPVFKVGFTSIAKTLVPMPTSPGPKQTLLLFIRLLVVFTLSGMVHVAGSISLGTAGNATHPYLTLLSFLLQAPGIAIQQALFYHFTPKPKEKTKLVLFKMWMLLFTLLWSMGTFPLVVADFADGRLFLIPVVPSGFVDLVMCPWKWLVETRG